MAPERQRENGAKHDQCFSTNVNYESHDIDHTTLSGNTCLQYGSGNSMRQRYSILV